MRSGKPGHWSTWKTRLRDQRALEEHCGMGCSWKLRRRARLFESKPPKLVAGARELASCGNRSHSTLLMQESRCARDATKRQCSIGRRRVHASFGEDSTRA